MLQRTTFKDQHLTNLSFADFLRISFRHQNDFDSAQFQKGFSFFRGWRSYHRICISSFQDCSWFAVSQTVHHHVARNERAIDVLEVWASALHHMDYTYYTCFDSSVDVIQSELWHSISWLDPRENPSRCVVDAAATSPDAAAATSLDAAVATFLDAAVATCLDAAVATSLDADAATSPAELLHCCSTAITPKQNGSQLLEPFSNVKWRRARESHLVSHSDSSGFFLHSKKAMYYFSVFDFRDNHFRKQSARNKFTPTQKCSHKGGLDDASDS